MACHHLLNRAALCLLLAAVACLWTCPAALAQETPPDLRLSVYLTSDSVQKLASDPAARANALAILKPLRISHVFLEFYRGGDIVDRPALESLRDFFIENGFEVTGGIATVPGGNVGLQQEAPLTWFNWQNPKTQEDIRRIISDAAPVFDNLIVDDFFCTSDLSAESQAAKGDRSWAEYRCDLMVSLAKSLVIDPAKQANPGIRVIIKFPQWYDRFHEFGYDVPRQAAQFDAVWVGTETRGAKTQRYGFVQPYEGFVNYRWVASIAGSKTLGAWFDHGDCDADDFMDQAYQSVLAGAPELTLFSYNAFEEGHPGHARLAKEYDALNALSKAARIAPVRGVPAYKPANSDPGQDMYVMDCIGMLGIPLVPVSAFPSESPVVFLPTQAASDTSIGAWLAGFIKSNKTVIMTAGFLARVQSDPIYSLAGIERFSTLDPILADAILEGNSHKAMLNKIDMYQNLTLAGAEVLLYAAQGEDKVPFLTVNHVQGAKVFVLNTRTYSQADFDAVGEVLLSPKWLGILDLPSGAAGILRSAFTDALELAVVSPSQVAVQPLSGKGYVVQNYNANPVSVDLLLPAPAVPAFADAWTAVPLQVTSMRVGLTVPARSRIWVSPQK